ncbi:hypothetical protein HYW17_00875 [Candidatus Uhrbacteria bacterium]|nr:hypothetical protein [Candidatus Uhrbacteria bacterium]
MNLDVMPTIDIRKYGGKQVAIVAGEIIATGDTLDEVIKEARTLAPKIPLAEIKIFSVPSTLSVIYYVADIPVRNYTA